MNLVKIIMNHMQVLTTLFIFKLTFPEFYSSSISIFFIINNFCLFYYKIKILDIGKNIVPDISGYFSIDCIL